jgi:HKD family nuclease
MNSKIIYQPDDSFRLGDFLLTGFSNESWLEFRAAIAFVKSSGVKHIQNSLSTFSKRAKLRISVGIDVGGTSIEGLTGLLDAVNGNGKIFVFHNENPSTFHPKIYLFKNDNNAEVLIGSGNLTEGGLYTNYEAFILIYLDLKESDDKKTLENIELGLDKWNTEIDGLCFNLSEKNIKDLIECKYIFSEVTMRDKKRVEHGSDHPTSSKFIFRRIKIKPAPYIQKETPDLPDEAYDEDDILIEEVFPVEGQQGRYKTYFMTLQKTDVGIGQVSKGTSRRSPEIFIPLAARDTDPEFWGWPSLFKADSSNPGKMDRTGVKMRIGTSIIDVNMMTWPVKHDFRLRSEHLRSAGSIGDILRIERSDGEKGFSYYVEVIPKDTTLYEQNIDYCSYNVKNSLKKWGYI